MYKQTGLQHLRVAVDEWNVGRIEMIVNCGEGKSIEEKVHSAEELNNKRKKEKERERERESKRGEEETVRCYEVKLGKGKEPGEGRRVM
jgi:hypothetical protein